MSVAAVLNHGLRVYLIEPQVLLAKALRTVLSEDDNITVVGESRGFDRADFIAARPDLIVLDCDGEYAELAEMRQLIVQCRGLIPNVRVCVLSSQLDPDVMLRSLAAGADGYVVKDVTPSELLNSVKRMSTEGFYADPRLASFLLRKRARREGNDLSPRELDVVRLIGQGLSNKEISERLTLSDKTVKNHISNIFSKLNFTARTQVAIYAIRHGIA